MTMNRATTAADLISYSETLAAPRPLAVHGPLHRLLQDASTSLPCTGGSIDATSRRHRAGFRQDPTGCPHTQKGGAKRRVFGSGFQFFMPFKISLGCGL
jgi:hypothetical protein